MCVSLLGLNLVSGINLALSDRQVCHRRIKVSCPPGGTTRRSSWFDLAMQATSRQWLSTWLPILLAARAHCLAGPRPAVTALRSTKGIPRRDLLVFGAAAATALGSARPAAASFGSARGAVTSPPKLRQGTDLESFENLLPGKQAQVESLLLPSQAEQLLQEINTQRLELQAA